MTRALLALGLVLGACVPGAEHLVTPAPNAATVRAAGTLVRADAQRAAGDADAAKRAATAIAAFDAQLYAQLAKQPGNIVFSPYSVATALAMTRDGARGATRDQMDAVLHAPTDLDAAFNALDLALAKRNGTYPFANTTVPLELATANQLFAQKDTELVKAYLDGLATYYGTGVGVVDYINAREDARKAINAWVSDRTKTRIPELVKPGVLNELTRLVLVNAVYLKAKWQVPFEKGATGNAPFHRVDGTTVSMQLMRATPTLSAPYARSGEYQAVSVSYVGGLSMVLIVPDAGAFARVESSLSNPTALQNAVELTSRASVNLAMPKFTFRTTTMLKDALRTLGMPLAFTDQADFTGMSTQERFQIQDVAHEAFILVDEDGTEGAAATAVFVGLTSAPSNIVQLTIDRPFLFAIRDDATGAILFMGRVLDPTAT